MTSSLGTTTVPGEFVAPFVPSPVSLVNRMLEVGRVGPGDTVYDLGAGDGRIVVAAAQRFGARAVGVELDNDRFALSSARIRDLGLEPRARMLHGDLLTTDLRPATVVTLYQLPSVNEMLRPALERQLRSGARVVTLDFPVQGWEASNVLTQLTDGSKHAIYLYFISEIRKESATMANIEASYGSAAACWLELQGASAGLLNSAEGGDATADVVVEKLGTDLIQRKHLENVNYEDITVGFGAGMSSSVYEWIADTLHRTYSPKDGAVVVANPKASSRLNFFGARISEIGFPAVDAGSKDAAYISLKIAPRYTTRATDSGLNSPKPTAGKQRLLPANFRLRIDGLDCSRVSRIDPLTITHQLISGAVGEQREYESEAGYLQTPNLAITLSEVGSETFRQWHEDFVIKGKNGSNMAKNGTLEYLDLKFTVLFTLTFRRLGIFKLTRERSGGENVPRLRAEMYCEEIGFQYETSAVSEKGAGAATAPASAATPTPYSSTAVVTPVSVQPFTEDAAYKEQKAALSPDLVAAPLRLGRPLRFRS